MVAGVVEAIEAAGAEVRYRDEYCERMKERGKPGSLIAAAVANRWLPGLYHEMVAIPA